MLLDGISPGTCDRLLYSLRKMVDLLLTVGRNSTVTVTANEYISSIQNMAFVVQHKVYILMVFNTFLEQSIFIC